jgi:hypothetical protein
MRTDELVFAGVFLKTMSKLSSLNQIPFEISNGPFWKKYVDSPSSELNKMLKHCEFAIIPEVAFPEESWPMDKFLLDPQSLLVCIDVAIRSAGVVTLTNGKGIFVSITGTNSGIEIVCSIKHPNTSEAIETGQRFANAGFNKFRHSTIGPASWEIDFFVVTAQEFVPHQKLRSGTELFGLVGRILDCLNPLVVNGDESIHVDSPQTWVRSELQHFLIRSL